jgi:SAM-dependent methyltransferase
MLLLSLPRAAGSWLAKHITTPRHATPRQHPQGDAEDLPFATDSFDRYVSAGSIEYWPEPQRGICEAYRVIKEGGVACMIGPVYPTFWLSRWAAARVLQGRGCGVGVGMGVECVDGQGSGCATAQVLISGPFLPAPLPQVLRRRVDAVPQGGGVHRGGGWAGGWARLGWGLGWAGGWLWDRGRGLQW